MASDAQLAICEKVGALPAQPLKATKLGVSESLKSDGSPAHGLRHPPTETTNGWYLWTGEISEADDFFQPLHLEHIQEWCPEVEPYLALPPGWRFLIAPGYEDIWFDDTLLEPA